MIKKSTQSGFAAMIAIVLLVILAGLATGLVKLSTTQQMASASDIQSSRAWQAAKAGNEWGLYKALRSNSCVGSTQLDLRSTAGFRVGVSCSVQTYNDGETAAGVPRSILMYTIEATACNSATTCPDASLSNASTYIERKRVVMACNTSTLTACN